VVAVAIDETSCRRGHDYLTMAADAEERKVVFVTTGRDAKTIARFAEHLATHKAPPEQINSVSIDMSPAFMRGVADHLPKALITFDKFQCRRPRLRRPRPNQAPRTAARSEPQRTALDAAQGSPPSVR
jgi:transposase